jgi:hypothetical protein
VLEGPLAPFLIGSPKILLPVFWTLATIRVDAANILEVVALVVVVAGWS